MGTVGFFAAPFPALQSHKTTDLVFPPASLEGPAPRDAPSLISRESNSKVELKEPIPPALATHHHQTGAVTPRCETPSGKHHKGTRQGGRVRRAEGCLPPSSLGEFTFSNLRVSNSDVSSFHWELRPSQWGMHINRGKKLCSLDGKVPLNRKLKISIQFTENWPKWKFTPPSPLFSPRMPEVGLAKKRQTADLGLALAVAGRA